MTNLSPDKIARTQQALEETITVLNRACSHSPDLQDEELINILNSHVNTLQKRLADATQKTYRMSFSRVETDYITVTANNLLDAIAIARNTYPSGEWDFNNSTIETN